MLNFYLLGSFVALILTLLGWSVVAFLKLSPLERNLRKVNWRLSWRSGRPSAGRPVRTGFGRLRFALQQILENMLWSWLGVFAYLVDRAVDAVKFLCLPRAAKQARAQLWNEDLEPEEVSQVLTFLQFPVDQKLLPQRDSSSKSS